jgi:3-hydroxymyristoyl/3-hydroxydecanoyl-(acyl carrier protein) dehydratase
MNRLRGEIRDMLRVEERVGGFSAVLDVDASLGVFPDHFRDGPILPGICLVHAVLLAGAQTRGVDELRIRVLKNLKLMQPVRPGQRVAIDAEMTPVGGSGGFAYRGDLAIKAKLSVGDQRCAEVSLVAFASAAEGKASAAEGAAG